MTARLRIGLLAGVGLLLVLAVLSAVGESAVDIGQGWTPGLGEPEQRADETPPAERRDDESESPPWVQTGAAILLMAILLLFGALFLFGLFALVIGFNVGRRGKARRDSAARVAASDEESQLAADLMRTAAGRALHRLRIPEGGEPGDAVVAAWLVLEAAVAEAGTARQPHQTATEFTAAVLADLRVDAGALDRLCGLYQRARFSRRPVTDADVADAAAALERVVADLDETVGSPA